MKINLELLKFHSFNKNKFYNNLTSKNNKSYFNELIYTKLQNVLNLFDKCENSCFLEKCSLRCHKVDPDKKHTIIYDVISNCHPTLYEEILQKSGEKFINDINLYICKLKKRERLVFIVFKDFKESNETLYPLLFDLKHCFYSGINKSFDDNKKLESQEWNFKDCQNEIKAKILANFNNC